ncbi:hypothetical protein CYLTODRAFT_412414 [Cylindrobasidium torrendii FP15055 ss-10]|uniref:Uncharacterized protein n=1 Tax=Cylindrobasidium torrendii FP15055 ss-10 TaxID=1314674 RepID=A0A0D7B6B6_9AGAR|nr:hypothetical protein CYLTODRAFT_412414 [Cylindrobasidium torrendii FP15055 ss-10]
MYFGTVTGAPDAQMSDNSYVSVPKNCVLAERRADPRDLEHPRGVLSFSSIVPHPSLTRWSKSANDAGSVDAHTPGSSRWPGFLKSERSNKRRRSRLIEAFSISKNPKSLSKELHTRAATHDPARPPSYGPEHSEALAVLEKAHFTLKISEKGRTDKITADLKELRVEFSSSRIGNGIRDHSWLSTVYLLLQITYRSPKCLHWHNDPFALLEYPVEVSGQSNLLHASAYSVEYRQNFLEDEYFVR